MTPKDLAERDARRLVKVLQTLGGEGARNGTGWMARDIPGSWAVYAAGLGLDKQSTREELDERVDVLIEFYRRHDRQPKIQINTYQHPELFAALSARGFVVTEYVHVFHRKLVDLPPANLPTGFSFQPLTREDQIDAFADSQLKGFEAPEGMRPIMQRVGHAGLGDTCDLVFIRDQDENVVGCGGVEYFEGSATLIAGEVHAHARRQGLQGAFIRHRMQLAKRAGAEYVLIGSLAGGPSERNALRNGLSMAFTVVDLELR